jgi:hypothetical protein
VWAFNIGAWYIRRFWAQGVPGKRTANAGVPQPFDVRDRADPDAGIVRKRKRGRLISMESPVEIDHGQVFIRDGKRYVPPGLRRR